MILTKRNIILTRKCDLEKICVIGDEYLWMISGSGGECSKHGTNVAQQWDKIKINDRR